MGAPPSREFVGVAIDTVFELFGGIHFHVVVAVRLEKEVEEEMVWDWNFLWI